VGTGREINFHQNLDVPSRHHFSELRTERAELSRDECRSIEASSQGPNCGGFSAAVGKKGHTLGPTVALSPPRAPGGLSRMRWPNPRRGLLASRLCNDRFKPGNPSQSFALRIVSGLLVHPTPRDPRCRTAVSRGCLGPTHLRIVAIDDSADAEAPTILISRAHRGTRLDGFARVTKSPGQPTKPTTTS
jgi:hypothetical protein